MELSPSLEQRQRLMRARGGGDLIASNLQQRRKHVAEKRRVIDQQHRALAFVAARVLAAEPVLKCKRQEVSDVQNLGGAPADHRRAEHAWAIAADADLETVLDNVDDL